MHKATLVVLRILLASMDTMHTLESLEYELVLARVIIFYPYESYASELVQLN